MNHTRRTFLETSLIAATALATGKHLLAGTPPARPAFPVVDYHVHLSPDLSVEQALALGKERQVEIGILEHPGPKFKIQTDADLQQYIDALRKYPVRIGLQPVYLGWSKSFSKNLLDQLDYVLMDALTLPKPDGGYTELWQVTTFVDDEEAFMSSYLQFIEQMLTTEPIDIFGWPTFLPVAIARHYDRLWTKARMQHVIDLAHARRLAIEINEAAHVPDETFITMAKRAGLKFTFGTDSRNQNATHFHYCYQMAQKCRLTEGDMFVPKKK